MKHLFQSVVFLGAAAVLGAVLVLPTWAAPLYQAPEHLTRKQLTALVASAKTPAEHERIAAYYRGESERLTDEADYYADLAGRFFSNPAIYNVRSAPGNRCISMERNLRAKSVKARALAEEHKRLARAAEQK
jgi:hypothetical protein